MNINNASTSVQISIILKKLWNFTLYFYISAYNSLRYDVQT